MTFLTIQLTTPVAQELVSTSAPAWNLAHDRRFERIDPMTPVDHRDNSELGVLLWCQHISDAVLTRALQEEWGRPTELWFDTSCRWWVVWSPASVDTWMAPDNSPDHPQQHCERTANSTKRTS